MAAMLLEGKPVAEALKAKIKSEIESLSSKHGKRPKLIAVQVGENASSAVYVKAQQKAAESLGIDYCLKQADSQEDALSAIDAANSDDSVTAVILQMPVPIGVDAGALMGRIQARKDAEGMHPQNLGRIALGQYKIGPCTAMAVMELLASIKADLYGKEAVVVGHSEIVGKPLALMLLGRFATTTVCHIATGQRGALADHVRRAEVLVVAVGKAGVVKGDWIREGAIVIDVGINKSGDKIVGDVEFEAASKKAAYITPVPGGVGPMTTTILMRNTLELFKEQTA